MARSNSSNKKKGAAASPKASPKSLAKKASPPASKVSSTSAAASSSSCFNICCWVVLPLLLAAVGAGIVVLRNPGRPDVPLKTWEYHHIDNAFPPEVMDRLVQVIEETGVFPAAVADQTSKVPHIGEAVPYDPVEGCPPPFFVPVANNTLCALPQRLDIARHHLLTGGRDGYKERYEMAASRMIPFLTYHFDKFDTPDMRLLFQSDRYLSKARDVCRDAPVMDEFQLNLILMLPGQELPMHFDAPYFWGASRFQLPQWLLVVMDQSGLFADRAIKQIQGVAWLHRDGSPNNTRTHGEFAFYPQGLAGPAVEAPSAPGYALILDGTKVAHGVQRFVRDATPPLFNKDADNKLVYVGDHKWEMRSDGKTLANYTTDDFRISLAWRARCFKTEEEKQRWANQGDEDFLKLEDVLATLEQDLRKKGVLKPDQPRPEPLEFALMLLDNYARYPIDNMHRTLIPYNYCALPKVLPKWAQSPAESLLNLVC